MSEQQKWVIILTERFEEWLNEQDIQLQENMVVALRNLETYGHLLARPLADAIKGSKFNNMKELRVQHQGRPIRAFFAFDPLRQAIVLCAGDKSNDKKFYERMISIADQEFQLYLSNLEYTK